MTLRTGDSFTPDELQAMFPNGAWLAFTVESGGEQLPRMHVPLPLDWSLAAAAEGYLYAVLHDDPFSIDPTLTIPLGFCAQGQLIIMRSQAYDTGL